MKAPFKCLFNHELLCLFTTETPYQTYRTPVDDVQVTGYVRELKGTGVDALMICPQAWMTNLWPSKVDLRWSRPERVEERLPEDDLKYYEKVYQRVSRYMRQGKDPVALTVKTTREAGIAPLLSYRMNENHYTFCPDCPTHSDFWRKHPQYRLQKHDPNLDYLHPEVQRYQLSLIDELINNYDIDGFECDFMRQAVFFPPDSVAEGTEVMTGIVRHIRTKLDEVGKQRGKRLYLCVRVPHVLGSRSEELVDGADFSRQEIGVATATDVG